MTAKFWTFTILGVVFASICTIVTLLGYHWINKQTDALSSQATELAQAKINEAAAKINAQTEKEKAAQLEEQLNAAVARSTQLELDYATARKASQTLRERINVLTMRQKALTAPTELGDQLTLDTMRVLSQFGELEVKPTGEGK